jgi:FlaA1/EpsC-like NDP-sugar epimerase
MPDETTTSALIKRILSERGWSQEDLARELEVSQQAVSRWIHAGTTPRRRFQEALELLAENRQPSRERSSAPEQGQEWRPRNSGARPKRALIVGAGAAGTFLVGEFRQQEPIAYEPVAFVDDNRAESPTGIPITGAIKDLPREVERARVDEVIIAAPAYGASVVRDVMDQLERQPVAISVLPREATRGSQLRRRLRPVGIRDLITPSAIPVHPGVSEMIRDKTILITGAGDWFGAALAREVNRFAPRRILLMDVFGTQLDAVRADLGDNVDVIMADLAYAEVLEAVRKRVGEHSPQIVFHAAGHHGTRTLEENGVEAVRTNFCGVRNLTDLLHTLHDPKHPLEYFVRISSTTAATPTSWMGMSSLLGERLLSVRRPPAKTAFSVRFGSLTDRPRGTLERLEEALRHEHPLMIPSANAERFFLSTQHAVSLTLTAAALRVQAPVAAINVGINMNLQHLAEYMIRLSSSTLYEQPQIRPTGATPHDQIQERLIAPSEIQSPIAGAPEIPDRDRPCESSTAALIGIEWRPGARRALTRAVDQITDLVARGETDLLHELLRQLVAS